MKLLFFCPIWGIADQPLEQSLRQIKSAGYDGVEYGCDLRSENKATFLDLCRELDLQFIMQQYGATGKGFDEYLENYKAHLYYLSGYHPLFVNSQTGKDFYTEEQNLALLQVAKDIERETGIKIIHETHRGKFAFCAAITLKYLQKFPALRLTGDFSHFCAVSESFLQDQEETIRHIIPRVDHIHARVGHPQGAQVTDPRLPEWKEAVAHHLQWWDAIIHHHRSAGTPVLTITPEFGPEPYMPVLPFTQQPLASQWEINLYMVALFQSRYNSFV
jgi:sugar phosphate isomerase/epimerase